MGTDFLIHKITMQVGTMSVTPQMQKQPIWMNNTSQSCEIAEFFDFDFVMIDYNFKSHHFSSLFHNCATSHIISSQVLPVNPI